MRLSMLLVTGSLALATSLTGSTSSAPAGPDPEVKQTSARSVSVGYWHHCVVTREPRVRCWGDGHWGELGTGNREDWARPAAVVGMPGTPVQVVAADRVSCALDEDGQVMCWGSNYGGQLGAGLRVNKRLRPVTVTGLDHPVTAMSGLDAHLCALQSTGSVVCWGDNEEGQIGPAASGWKARQPVGVPLPRPAQAVSAGGDMSCAILDDDTLWCWGGRYGETPTLVREDVGDVSVGTGHACLVTLTGAAMCWGLNYYGSLGDGTTDNHRTPVPVVGLETGVAQVEAGNGISCAHLADDTVRCWGMTGLGEGGSPQYLTPTRINGVGAVDHLDVGLSDVCVVTGLGETRCWGVYPEAPMIAVTSLGLEGGSRVVRQPDLLVASPATNHLVGEGVYNSSGMDQTREVRTQVSRSATFLVQVQNDGDEADVFFVGAHAPRQSKVTTRYSIDGQKVTQRIRYGTLHRTLAPGDSFDVMVTVLLDGEVWPHERLYTRLFAWSTHDQSSSDSVLAIVDVARRQ